MQQRGCSTVSHSGVNEPWTIYHVWWHLLTFWLLKLIENLRHLLVSKSWVLTQVLGHQYDVHVFVCFSPWETFEDLLSGDDGDAEDLTLEDDEVAESHEMQLRKKLGIPELDPDALPSTMINKFLSLAITIASLWHGFSSTTIQKFEYGWRQILHWS